MRVYFKVNDSSFRLTSLSDAARQHYDEVKGSLKKTKVRSTGSCGKGLFVREDVKKGSHIIEYIGELVDEQEYLRRYSLYKSRSIAEDYFATIKRNEFLDATVWGNHGRFVNHSCNPNSRFKKIRLRGSNITLLFIAAKRDIRKGEEITVSYDWYKSETEAIDLDECKCGSLNCRGYI